MNEMSLDRMDEIAGGQTTGSTLCGAAFATAAVGALVFGPLASIGTLALGYAVCREAE